MNKSLEQYMPDGSKLPYRFMKYRIHKILLVCCSYDGYILEEDGHIESQINQEYIDLNMSNPPSQKHGKAKTQKQKKHHHEKKRT